VTPTASRSLRRSIKRLLWNSGYYAARLARDRFPGVAVLCYHGVRADDWPDRTMAFEQLHVRASELEAHCRVVRDYCDPISLADWRLATAGDQPLPRRPVLLTFDDGYRTAFIIARPILRRYELPAAFFVCTDLVEQRTPAWYDAVARAAGEAEAERLKARPFGEWREARDRWSQAIEDDDPHAPLTVSEVSALAETRGFEIGSHTASHPILARASVEEQRDEIARSKACLEAWTGRSVRAFAYPNGRPRVDYTAETVAIVRELGFDAAFTTRAGFATRAEPPLERSRFVMLAGVTADELAHRLAHTWA
jgi:peptidoglycan/xylan/chitin deacetylase (PgdA/CDA1 family)